MTLVAPSTPVEPRPATTAGEPTWPYLLLGIGLGIVFTRSEVVSWFRIQEMFRFQSFHMYGIIGSAVVVGGITSFLIRRFELSSWTGRPIEIPREPFAWPGARYWLGGTLFGLGWGLLGACPGPIYVLIGNGVSVMLVAFLAAIGGAWSYGTLRPHLPHD